MWDYCGIEEKGKNQPIHNEDESIWAVCDGEIYNYKELKEEMEKSGHEFYTSMDTEVIVHLYEEFGDFFVKKLNDVFCFGILDNNEKKILLARDKIGIKPLYYTTVGKILLFASEIKSILQYERVKREVNIKSLHYLLNIEYIPGEVTLFKGIKKLLPGHILVHKDDDVHIHKYWDIIIRTYPQKSEEYYITHITELLKKAVERRMDNGKSLGVFLTGGMDTSSVVAIMRSLTDEPIKSFYLSFGEDSDDINYSRIVAEHFETEHHEMMVEPKEIKILPEAIWWMDEPSISVISGYFASKFASKHVKTVFTGRGGDELVGGYERFKYIYLSTDIHRIIPRYLSRSISKLIEIFQSKYSKLEWAKYNKYLRVISGIGNKEKFYVSVAPTFLVDGTKIYSNKLSYKKLGSIENIFEPYFNNDGDFLNEALLAEVKEKLVNDLLIVDNRMSAVNSIKQRYPLLDIDLVEFSFTIPSYLKSKGYGKYAKIYSSKGYVWDTSKRDYKKAKKRGILV